MQYSIHACALYMVRVCAEMSRAFLAEFMSFRIGSPFGNNHTISYFTITRNACLWETRKMMAFHHKQTLARHCSYSVSVLPFCIWPCWRFYFPVFFPSSFFLVATLSFSAIRNVLGYWQSTNWMSVSRMKIWNWYWTSLPKHGMICKSCID